VALDKEYVECAVRMTGLEERRPDGDLVGREGTKWEWATAEVTATAAMPK
jgi:hypothetical protein